MPYWVCFNSALVPRMDPRRLAYEWVCEMSGLWDELRQMEGMEYPPASWFWVPNEILVGESGHKFSGKQGGRPVVLARISGPIATVYPRSANIGAGYSHSSHVHEDAQQRCAVNQDGWIKFRHPITIPSKELSDSSYSCLEPVPDSLVEVLDRALRKAFL